MVQFRRSRSERRFEQFIGKLLRVGVIIATSIVSIGGFLYLIRHGTEAPNYQFFRGESAEFRSLLGVETSILSGRYRGIIQLGLILLIATPIIRVIFSLIAFVRHQDFTYMIVTLIVLMGLMYSLIGGYF